MSEGKLLTLDKASQWASGFVDKDISKTNISYLVQYGKVRRLIKDGKTFVSIDDLKNYYKSFHGQREVSWRKKLGNDLDWGLSFDHLREKDTTKHVHRLHPYKGKFIPQLVEYFIDEHQNDYKKEVYFKKGDIILDPFAGSGTMLVQAKELGLHSIGIDISRFNSLISQVKLLDYDFTKLEKEIGQVIEAIKKFESDNKIEKFELELYKELSIFNNKYFPSPKYKYELNLGKLNEKISALQKEAEFNKIYDKLIKKYDIKLKQKNNKTFLDKWYSANVRSEIEFAFFQLKKIKDRKIKSVIAIILSRTIRSCRATTHSDLATLKEPQLTIYYCYKHKKICKPIFSIKYWFERYAKDTISRLKEYADLKSDACYSTITADSRTVKIFEEVKKKDVNFHSLLLKKKIKGMFSSPPYVGQINYHEQHAYAYDLFGFDRRDGLEIGPLYKGQGQEARNSYIEGISDVLNNCKKFFSNNYNVFLVANDKYNLYPKIARRSGMKIVREFKRPVLNRTERDKSPYSEIIFHLKEL